MVRILYLEDSEEERQAVSRALERAGHEVESTNTVAKAITLVRGGTFDVLITDHLLITDPLSGAKGPSGISVAREAREHVRQIFLLTALEIESFPDRDRKEMEKIGIEVVTKCGSTSMVDYILNRI
ncbi:MAG: response regulator [Candidatus Peregrinibacteria bacterium]